MTIVDSSLEKRRLKTKLPLGNIKKRLHPENLKKTVLKSCSKKNTAGAEAPWLFLQTRQEDKSTNGITIEDRLKICIEWIRQLFLLTKKFNLDRPDHCKNKKFPQEQFKKSPKFRKQKVTGVVD